MTRLVLLPGMDGTGTLFGPFTAALGGRMPVITVTYPADQPLDYAQLQVRVRECLPMDEPFLLLGESFSGPVAIAIAANAPRNLAGLILCCSFATNPRPSLAILKPLIRVLPDIRSARMASPLLLGASATPALQQQLGAALARVSIEVLRARLRATMEVDMKDALQRVSVPILYLRATLDRLVPKSACDLIASLAPQTHIAEVRAPHMLLQAAPAESAAIVNVFEEQVFSAWRRRPAGSSRAAAPTTSAPSPHPPAPPAPRSRPAHQS